MRTLLQSFRYLRGVNAISCNFNTLCEKVPNFFLAALIQTKLTVLLPSSPTTRVFFPFGQPVIGVAQAFPSESMLFCLWKCKHSLGPFCSSKLCVISSFVLWRTVLITALNFRLNFLYDCFSVFVFVSVEAFSPFFSFSFYLFPMVHVLRFLFSFHLSSWIVFVF